MTKPRDRRISHDRAPQVPATINQRPRPRPKVRKGSKYSEVPKPENLESPPIPPPPPWLRSIESQST